MKIYQIWQRKYFLVGIRRNELFVECLMYLIKHKNRKRKSKGKIYKSKYDFVNSD